MDNKIAELAEQISIMKRQLTKAINSGNEAKALKLIKIKEELDKDFEELLQQVAIAEERERKAEEESHNEIEDERVETEHKTGSGLKKKILKLKKRPPRVYVTKTGRFYIIKNGNKIYIQIPKTEKPISQKQLQKQIVNVVLTHPKYYVPIKKRKRTFSKTGKVYFQTPFIKGLVGSKFGFANTQKNIIGKEIASGIYEPHTLPNYTPRPTLVTSVEKKSQNLLNNIPQTLDESQTSTEKNTMFKLIRDGQLIMNEPKNVTQFSKLTVDSKREFIQKLIKLYPDYQEQLIDISKLNNNLISAGLSELNIPYKKLYPKIDELTHLLEGHSNSEKVINFILKGQTEEGFKNFINNLKPEINPLFIPETPIEKKLFTEPEFDTIEESKKKKIRAEIPIKVMPVKQVLDYFNTKEETPKSPIPPGVSPRIPLPAIYTPRTPSNRAKELAKEASNMFDTPMPEELRLSEIERLKSIKNPTKAEKVALNLYIRNLPAKLGQEDQDQSYISGAGKYSNWRKGLYDTEIHKIMEHKAKRFVPVIMSDEIPKLLPYVNQKTKEFAFIINSTSSKTSGQHWRAIFIDVPNSEIDYYDSLVSSPTKEFLRDIKLLIDKIDPNTYMKLKINMIKQQADDTENCGFFSCKFIIDRFKNKPFKNACGSDKSDMGEYEIEKFKNYL